MAERLEKLRHPFALGTGLEKNPRGRTVSEHRSKPLAAGDDPLLGDAVVRRKRATVGNDCTIVLS
jgi:hypothetical protein